MAEPTMTLTELQAKIARRVWENREFEAEFMTDPKGTLEKYTGRKLADELAIHAHYNSPTELHFVIPRRPASVDHELTDEDLERVAGGELSIVLTISVVASALFSVTAVHTLVQEAESW